MSDLILQSLPYARDSSYLLSLFAKQPMLVFLDSGLSNQAEARYDILTALPSASHLLTPADNQSDCQADCQSDRPGKIFAEARNLLAQHKARSENPDIYRRIEHLPFCGGLLACLAYDLTGVSNVSRTSGSDLGNVPAAMLGIYDWAIIVDHQLKQTSIFVLPQCPAETRDIVMEHIRLLVSDSDAENNGLQQRQQDFSQKKNKTDFYITGSFQPLVSKTAYAETFQRLQNYILAGDCYQTNLSIPFAAPFTGRPVEAYHYLRQRSRSPFSAYIDAGEFQVLSLSPERFISVKNGRAFTQPIKGTRKRLDDRVQDQANIDDLLSSEKDRAENLMIVDLLRNDLGRVCITGSVKTESLFALHSFTHVHHLISSISGQLPDKCSPLLLLEHCFPGGSITGAPKVRAMQIIAELEAVPRSMYCGSILYCDYLDRMDSNICIRTLLATAGHLYCWGGGGIVADSDMEQEYQECLDKVSVLMELPQPN